MKGNERMRWWWTYYCMIGLNIFGNIYRYKDTTHTSINKDCIESPRLIYILS